MEYFCSPTRIPVKFPFLSVVSVKEKLVISFSLFCPGKFVIGLPSKKPIPKNIDCPDGSDIKASVEGKLSPVSLPSIKSVPAFLFSVI